MVKRLVRASSLSVRLLYFQFFSALKAVKPVNPFLPSCSGAKQHHADSCIWQVRGLALQKELCKQRHLPPSTVQPLPAPFQLPCTKVHKEQPHCGFQTQRLLYSKAFFAAHLKVHTRWHSSSQAPPCLCCEAESTSTRQLWLPGRQHLGRQREVGS